MAFPSTVRLGLARRPRVPVWLLHAWLLVIGVVWAGAAAAQTPELRTRVTDTGEILSSSTRERLESTLAEYEQRTGHQFAFLSVPSLEGDAIEDFSMRVAEQWKLGDSKRDDGLMLVVAKQERKMRIEVGYGLEGVVPDAIAARVIREHLRPAFVAGDFDAGVLSAFDALMKAAEGESLGEPVQKRNRPKRSWISYLPFLIVALAFMGGGIGGGRHRRSRGFFLGPGIGMGGGGFRSGGGGFGGFSGGGGGFGGGGASGGW